MAERGDGRWNLLAKARFKKAQLEAEMAELELKIKELEVGEPAAAAEGEGEPAAGLLLSEPSSPRV